MAAERRITLEEKDEMKAAFHAAEGWTRDGSIISAEQDGWRFWIGAEETSEGDWEYTGSAVCVTRAIEVELTPTVAEFWYRLVSQKQN